MGKYLSTLFLVFVSFSVSAQTFFEPGYFITNDGEINEVLIKNEDWKSNPTSFTYKVSEEAETHSLTIDDIKEFGIAKHAKFIKATVEIDKSANDINSLSRSRTPNFETEIILLRVIVEGKGNLYQYNSKNLERFFYTNQNLEIEQLIYRRFLIGESIVTDTKFQDQLKLNLQCQNFDEKSYSSLSYSRRSMIAFFKEFNDCNEVESLLYIDTRKRDLFNLTLKLGFNSVSLSLRSGNFNNNFNKQVIFDGYPRLNLGLEAEFVLPYNNNKWNILIQPEYQSFKENTNAESSVNYKVDYKSLDIPISVRYKMFFSTKSTFYLSSGVVLNFPFSSTIIRNGLDLDVEPTPNLIASFGYIFNQKINFELGISSKRELFSRDTNNFGKYQYSYFTIGYSLF